MCVLSIFIHKADHFFVLSPLCLCLKAGTAAGQRPHRGGVYQRTVGILPVLIIRLTLTLAAKGLNENRQGANE